MKFQIISDMMKKILDDFKPNLKIINFDLIKNPKKFYDKFIDEKIILKDPNCVGLRPIKAFFIRINELPHIIDKLIRYNHFFIYFFSKKRIQSN